MTFSALPVTFLLLGLVPLCGPSKRDACPAMASFIAEEEINFPMSQPQPTTTYLMLKIIHSAIVHENLLLGNNNTNSSVIHLLLLHAKITLYLCSIGLHTLGRKVDIAIC